LDRLDRAQPAAELDGHAELPRDPLQMLQVRGSAVARAVEIDDVQPAGTALDPRARRGQRLGVVDRLLREVALREPHGLAAADVDGRVEDHAATARSRSHVALKLASRRRPALEDFSGWNCTPKTFSRATAVAKRSPYSAVASTSSESVGCAA